MRARRGALAVAALAAFVVAFVRHDNGFDVAAAFFHASPRPGARTVFHFDVFDPFRPGHGYLWLGIAVAFTAMVIVLSLIRRRGGRARRAVASGSVVAAVACAAVTLAQRHDSQLGRREFEGAYFERNGHPANYSVSGTDLLAPFTPLDAYLWLGLTIGFAAGALVALLPATRNPRHGRE